MGKYEEIQGKVAIVTGAARGIGRAIALRLAAEGASIVVTDVDMAAAGVVVEEIKASGRKAVAMKVDVVSQKEIDDMILGTVKEFGELNIFVNNAGIGAIARLLDTDEQTWDRVMAINAKGTFLACKAAAKQMIKQNKGGRIIVNASGAGKIAPGKGTPLGAYAASKHAVVGFTKQLALEVAQYQILVNSLCPGIVDTPLWDQIDRETAKIEGVPVGSVKARAVASVPLGRIQTPEDVANMVVFLASDEASYVTADAINCAGGLLPY
jgi:meso-butanediol dehydrogenase / (S,S)-butanediol dehydrogenase / diacetyl reductase